MTEITHDDKRRGAAGGRLACVSQATNCGGEGCLSEIIGGIARLMRGDHRAHGDGETVDGRRAIMS